MLPSNYLENCQGQFVYVSLRNNDLYWGFLREADRGGNLNMTSVTRHRAGQPEVQLPHALIRGGVVKFIALPESMQDVVTKKRQETTRGQQSAPRGDRRQRDYDGGGGARDYGGGGRGGRGGYGRGRGRGGRRYDS
jgi:small nuclear ribonucleoprotein (snRNP)-like protein